MTKLLWCLALAAPAWAHDPITTRLTWTREISRIVYRRCVSCHREGGTAMSLARYEEARPWAKAIKEEVLERRMPPWGAVKGFGEFANDAGLSQEEIELIADWVEGGAPEGEPQYLPPMPAVSPEAAPPRGREAIVSGKLRLREPLAITVLRPASIAAGSSVQVIAVRPDASVEPLLWLYNYDPKWQRAYVLREPLRLPAGSEIRVSGGASVAVLFAAQR